MKMIKFLMIAAIAAQLFGFGFLPSSAAAATSSTCNTSSSALLGMPTWYKYLDPQVVDGECELDFDFPDDVGAILLAVIEILLRVAAYAAVVMIIYGGFRYQLSLGSPEGTKNARTILLNAIIGLMVAIFATAIVNLIGRNVIT